MAGPAPYPDPFTVGTPVATGDNGLTVLPTEIDFDPVRGFVVRAAWECFGENPAIISLAQTLANQGIGYTLKLTGHKSELRARYSGSLGNLGLVDVAQHNWQLLGNTAQRSIFKSNLAQNLEEATPGSLAFIRSLYDDLTQQDANSAQAAVNALPDGDVKTILNYLLQGTTHFDVSQPVLKYSGSISNFYSGDVATSDLTMLQIWTTEALLTNFAIPPFESQRISQFTSPVITPANYLFGWLQMGTTVITDAQNRKSVSTEWVLDNWSTDFYVVA